MKKLLLSLICLTGTFLFQSCSEEDINSQPDYYAQPNAIYGNRDRVQQYINNIYMFVPRGYNRLDVNPASNDALAANGSTPAIPSPGSFTSMVAAATDEAVHATRNSASERWGTGIWGAGPTNNWDSPIQLMYTGIRRTFTYAEDLHPNIIPGTGTVQLSAVERDQYYGEVLFLRALFNFELLKRFGGYPIVKNQLVADANLNIPKSSYDECVKYITALCDEATPVLPLTFAAGQSGRATRGAALALKARVLLYAASPLNNTGGDVAKWDAAAAANSAVMKLNIYSLYTAGRGYEDFFITLVGNNEIIFSRMDVPGFVPERLNGIPSILGGLGGTNPTLDMVNAYEMADGTPFSWSNPVHAANPFGNRDPRLVRTILFNQADWISSGSPATVKVETFVGGKDMQGLSPTRTGFYLRKFLGLAGRWNAPTATVNHSFPIFRYGETLLNYAEAMNEAYGPDADPKAYGMTARQAITLIRNRAGLTANQSVPSATSQALMRTAIRNERRIELAFEEHRHLDLRRWKTAEIVLSQPVSGLKAVRSGTSPNFTYTYTPEIVEQRVFTAPKMYLYPFPQEELSRNSSLIQNTGW